MDGTVKRYNLIEACLEKTRYQRTADGTLKRVADYGKFIKGLDQLDALCVLLVDFNCQIGTGGFKQWNNSIHSAYVEELKEHLEEIGTPAADQVLALVIEAQGAIDFFAELQDAYTEAARRNQRLASFEADFDDIIDEKLSNELTDLEVRYFEIRDQLLNDIEAHLGQGGNKK